MATKKPRFTITLDDELYAELEDFRFEGRYETKSDAIAALIALGIRAANEEKEGGQQLKLF